MSGHNHHRTDSGPEPQGADHDGMYPDCPMGGGMGARTISLAGTDCKHERVSLARVCTLTRRKPFPIVQAVCLDCGKTVNNFPKKEDAK